MKTPKKLLVADKLPSPKIKKVEVEEREDIKPNISDETVLKAIDAVNKLVSDFQSRKNILFADDTSFLLQIELIKVPRCPKRKLRLMLPHWLVTDTSDICLFVSDLKRGKRVDHEPTVFHYEDLLKEKGITNIKAVIPVRQVRVEYDQLDMRRRLLTQYDFFLTDSRVSGLLAHKLGSIFFNKNALPTPVKMDSPDLKEAITKALHKTTIRIHGQGDSFLVKVGIGKQTTIEICENIQSILLQLSKKFPGGWENIRSVHLKSPQSMSIPIYITLKNKNKVMKPRVKPLHTNNTMVEGSVTTVMGAKLQVYPDGRVKIIKRKGGEEDDGDESDDDLPRIVRKKVKTESNKNKDSMTNNKETDKVTQEVIVDVAPTKVSKKEKVASSKNKSVKDIEKDAVMSKKNNKVKEAEQNVDDSSDESEDYLSAQDDSEDDSDDVGDNSEDEMDGSEEETEGSGDEEGSEEESEDDE